MCVCMWMCVDVCVWYVWWEVDKMCVDNVLYSVCNAEYFENVLTPIQKPACAWCDMSGVICGVICDV